MLSESQTQALAENGYCLLTQVSVGGLMAASELLGVPRPSTHDGPAVDYLTPKSESTSRPGTISSQYGLHQFPWHSDGAVDKDPPRYVLLRAEIVDHNSATTDILDLHSLLDGKALQKYSRLVCEVSTRRDSYLAPFVTSRDGTWCAKWDPLRMKALGRKAGEFRRDVMGAEPTKRHQWDIGDLLVIDNWRCLHRRSRASTAPRVLQRVVVKSRPE